MWWDNEDNGYNEELGETLTVIIMTSERKRHGLVYLCGTLFPYINKGNK